MRERPILFSGRMVRAILEGRKTQTRRVVSSPYAAEADAWAPGPGGLWESGIRGDGGGLARGERIRCPYGRPGVTRLWVRETWRSDAPQRVAYAADGWCGAVGNDGAGGRIFLQHGWLSKYATAEVGAYYGERAYGMRWRPSIHMPRWASRISLEVTGVRVERLQEIAEEDAKAEGVLLPEAATAKQDTADVHGLLPYRAVFAACWDSINGKRPGASWSANPWVWVIEFRRLPHAASKAA